MIFKLQALQPAGKKVGKQAIRLADRQAGRQAGRQAPKNIEATASHLNISAIIYTNVSTQMLCKIRQA